MDGNAEITWDYLILLDGLHPLADPFDAASSDGRFLFSIDNFKRTVLTDDGVSTCTSFDLDIFDVLLSKRTRISCCDSLHDFGNVFETYALDAKHFVIVDQSKDERGRIIVRQWVIEIDGHNETASCIFYRTYGGLSFIEDDCEVSIGRDEIAVSNADKVVLFPKNPLSDAPARHFPDVFTQVEECAEILYGLGRPMRHDPETAEIYAKPFFLTPTVLAYFLTAQHLEGRWDYGVGTVIVIDIETGSCYLQELESALPLPLFDNRISERNWKQGSENEVIFTARSRMSASEMERTFVLSLSTRTLQWTELTGSLRGRARVAPTADGNAVILVDNIPGWVKMTIGQGSDSTTVIDSRLMDRIRVLATPNTVPSLTYLARIAAQQRGRKDSPLLEIIYDRLS
ncbi:hypothetical protein PRIPAC_89628 [Pristionchus pacificus]|uniref:Uncharacterized protein n=1 Tax=Pristionchus pacificus TaxID=54126 RepID=A0A2A6B8X5_PRIPA|nr:hypothetical protein PRIPAC_89628 [Pristionchus pacificus]|eukprot:PDM62328.1 hypothetical protein PRIPAC_51770 [Pristionchus pacificus]